MEIRINLEFNDGDFDTGFGKSQLKVMVTNAQGNVTQLQVELPPHAEIPVSYQHWKEQYYSLLQYSRSGFNHNQITQISENDCVNSAQSLQNQMYQWLQPVQLELEKLLQLNSDQEKEIYLAIHTDKIKSNSVKDIIHRLPWQEQDLFLKNYASEVALCFNSSLATNSINQNYIVDDEIRRVKILSIFGDSKNIDTKQDLNLLAKLKKQGAELITLNEPNRSEFNALWEESCDILFFAGHSETEANGQSGVININAHDSLNLAEIKQTLKTGINNGLKLAIFNSCDGLGLAKDLSDLNLPYIIVWREAVPDKIAQKFLKYFLSSFANGKSLFASVNDARTRLLELADKQNIEKQLPGVNWLPIICQNTDEQAPSWSDLGGLSGKLPESPYQGLSAFKEEDTDFFFGREQFVDELLTSVQTQSFIPIVGASGSGKSSIVFAGLVSRLRQLGNIEIISFRPGNNPLGNLAVALNHDYSHLTQFINNRDDNAKHLVLIADQFEELYTLAPPESRQPFLNALIYAINHAPKFTLILTLRSDFYSQALSYRPFGDALQQKNCNLAPLNREDLRCVIEKPAQKMKVELEKGLTETLIKDLGNELGRLPLLELTLAKLWQKQKKWYLTHEAYQEIGGLQKVLANYADTVLDKLSQYDKKRAEKIFIQLVRPGEGTEDTRRVATKKDVGEVNWDLVQQLADARLLVTNRVETCNGIEETVEIIHEALIKEWGTLHQWIQNNRQFRTWQERLRVAIQQWQEMQQDEEALLRGALLLKAEEKLKERLNDLTQYEQDYIQQSIELRRRHQKLIPKIFYSNKTIAELPQISHSEGGIIEITS
ncbi:hypothetical protein RIVM261_041640 [Rivularia sp. IAM M-261]|nr:hypothetical protein RIVM261_041640 [Rivularia sp. IAM M-261]